MTTAEEDANIATADTSNEEVDELERARLEAEGQYDADEASNKEPANGMGSDGVYRVEVNGYPKTIEPKPNPLHEYNTSTYLFSLHLLNKDTYNQLSESRQLGSKEVKFKTDSVLIASGGNTRNRNPLWKENFFIENVDMTTIIGLSSTTQGANAVNLKFTIIEPRGLTLIERLISSAEGTSYATYLEMVFALQIEFIAYDDGGNIVNLPNHTKYVPIKFTGITFKVSERGTEYTVSAVPYNHIAFNTSHSTAPTSISITAATVSDYFTDYSLIQSSAGNGAGDGADAQNAALRRQGQTGADDGAAAQAAALSKVKPKYTKSTSWASALNKLERFRKKNDAKYVPDQYQIIFGNEIMDSKLSSVTEDKKAEITSTPMDSSGRRTAISDPRSTQFDGRTSRLNASTDPRSTTYVNPDATVLNKVPPRPTGTAYTSGAEKTNWDKRYKETHNVDGSPKIPEVAKSDAATAATLRQDTSSQTNINGAPTTAKPGEVEYGAVTYNVNAGTSLISEINRIVRNSSFFLEQLDFSDSDSLKKLSKEKLAELAAEKNKELKWWRITSDVQLLDFDPTRNTYAKKITYYVDTYTIQHNLYPGTKKLTEDRIQPRKEYNYLFTGKNVDILNFNLDFNTTYYVAVSTDLNKNSSTSNSATVKQKDDQETKALETSFNKDALANPQRKQQSGNNASTAGSGVKRDPLAAVTADIQTQLFGRPSGDLVTLDMTIIGDPDFIKQDDVFSGAIRDESKLNGSIPMDVGEVYLRVNFNTPTDFDDATGLVRSSTQSKFSGFYRLLTIENNFQSGKFTQKLNAVRIFADKDTGPPVVEPKKSSLATVSAQAKLKDPSVGANAEGNDGEAEARANMIETETTKAPAEVGVEAFGGDGTESQSEVEENAELAQVADTAPATAITDTVPVVNTPAATLTPKTVSVTDPNTTTIDDGVYQFKDPLGKSNVVAVNTQEGVDAIAAATKTGQFAIYVDNDPNLGWVKFAYNPATGSKEVQEVYGDTPPQSKK